MLDVHLPHGRLHGLRDFLLHLFTITVGLLIALALEAWVERLHHRHLVHEAEIGMHDEIASNARALPSLRQQVASERKELDSNLDVLKQIKAHPHDPHGQFSVTFRMQGFNDVTWKAAQSTGALALMPYSDAATYSGIYDTQNEVDREQREIVTSLMQVGAIVITKDKAESPSPAQIDTMKERIGLVQFRLLLLSSVLDSLEKEYADYLKQNAR